MVAVIQQSRARQWQGENGMDTRERGLGSTSANEAAREVMRRNRERAGDCPECGEKQEANLSGVVCPNGHGY